MTVIDLPRTDFGRHLCGGSAQQRRRAYRRNQGLLQAGRFSEMDSAFQRVWGAEICNRQAATAHRQAVLAKLQQTNAEAIAAALRSTQPAAERLSWFQRLMRWLDQKLVEARGTATA